MKLGNPILSVVICNHNHGRFLDQAIASAVEQDAVDEVVVVDDGSTDDSQTVLDRWAKRVRVIRQSNQGQRRAYHVGFSRTRGAFVLFLDADDFLFPGSARKILESFGPDTAKVHFRMQLVDEAGGFFRTAIPSRLDEGEVGVRLLEEGLLYASSPGSGNAYRREAIDRLFPLPADPEDRHGADYFLIYGSVFFGGVSASRAALAAYRLHEPSISSDRPLGFGNVGSKVDPARRFRRRSEQLREWLRDRTGGRVVLPDRLLDFSQQKTAFVRSACEEPGFSGRRSAAGQLPDLLVALWKVSGFSSTRKVAITGWALAVMLGPRFLTRPLARYVSNPATRG